MLQGLQAAGGEASNSSTLSRWRRQVSQSLDLLSDSIVFAPVMPWAEFIALVNASAALGRSVQMGPGTWTCDAAVALASNAHIIGGPGVVVNCTAGILSDVTNAAFLATGTPVGSNTTLAANNVVGAKTISVVSLLSGAIADGALVQVRQGLRNLTYTVVGAPAGGGPYTVTLDRPVLMQFALGDTVFPYSAVPTDIRIDGRGMLITGAMDRFIELAQAFRCRVSGIRMLTTTAHTDLVASFDVGGYDCIFEDIEIDGAGTRGLGIALESVEKGAIINCRVKRLTSYGIALYDCCDCRVDGCDATETANGIVLGTDGGNALAGSTVRHHDIDLSASALGINAAGYANVGTLVSGGAGAAQDVTWPDIRATDHITWTRTVDGGVPGVMPLCTKTAATKFTATFAAGDTSTYEYRVE